MSLYDDYRIDCQFAADFPHGVPGKYWTTRDGTEIEVKEMTETHIRNCMRKIGKDDPWYAEFCEELKRRGVSC
jgi:hypothetical protein